MTVRFGVLGAGRIGQVHARAVASVPGARLVAVADPVDVVALDDLRMRAQGLRLEVVVAAESQLREKIAELWSQVVTEDALEKFVSELSIDEEVNLEGGEDEGAVALDDRDVARRVDPRHRGDECDAHRRPARRADGD